MSHDELLKLSDVYAIGALDGAELEQFQAHLSSGCDACQTRIKKTADALTFLANSLTPSKPPDRVKTRLFERIDMEKPGLVFSVANDGDWRVLSPGIDIKVLNTDPERQRVTALVRMAPGSRYKNHRHSRTEELVVIEGSCHCGGKLMKKGDYHRAEAGTIHLDTRTDDGSLMLIITSVQNEMLA